MTLPTTGFAGEALAQLRTNPRLRWGAWLILGILWLYLVLVLRDLAADARTQYTATLKKIGPLRAAATQAQWPSRLAAAQALRMDLESRRWNEGSIGLAQASFQDWLAQAARVASLQKTVMTVAVQDESNLVEKGTRAGVPDLWKATAKLSFDFNPSTFNSFLAGLVGNPKWIGVESLTIRTTPTPRVDMTAVAYFVKPKPVGEPIASPPKGPGR